jgi:hypothetical protein
MIASPDLTSNIPQKMSRYVYGLYPYQITNAPTSKVSLFTIHKTQRERIFPMPAPPNFLLYLNNYILGGRGFKSR